MKLTALISLLIAVTSVAQAQQYAAGFLPPPPGYEQASINDVLSASFVAQYNTVGLSFVNQTFAGAVCCVFQLREGYLTFGGTFLEPFAGGVDVCTTGTAPANTTFGVPTFEPGPLSGVWLKQLDAKALSLLGVNSTQPSISDCGAGIQHTVVLKQSAAPPPPVTPAPTTPAPQLPYMISPYGAHYAAPSGYRAMALSDVLSTSFVSYYNANGIRLIGNYTSNYCCMLQLQDNGWLTYGAEGNFSPFSLFVNGYWSCGSAAMGGLVTLGTSFGGPYQLEFPTLNATTLSLVGEFYNNTMRDFDGCQSLDDSLTMWTLQ